MAVSSALNPSNIVQEKSSSADGAKNFITGGSPLGTGVVAGAANRIVQFQRGAAAGVAAKPPDLQSMISTLSTNILNNVQNQVSSINNNVTQFVQQKLGEIQQNYRSRIDQIDAARPNAILNNFLSLYKEAIGYIQFLGNPRNVKTLRKNLRGLQDVFVQTFRVARIIRSTIGKIVKQLSSLPQASTGPGGINLDINVPGGGLKRSAPRGISRLLRNPAVMMGGAALAGGLGSRVVSGMLDAGDGGGGVQGVPMSGEAIPTTLLDRFSGILERFSQAIQAFGGGSRQTQASSSSGGSSSASPGSGSPSGPGAGASPTTGDTSGSSPEMGAGAQGPKGAATRALLDSISFAEGTTTHGYHTQFGGGRVEDLSKHPDQVIRTNGYASAAFGRYQFMPGTWSGVMGGAMTPERQDAAAVKLTISRLNQAGIRVRNEDELEALLQKEGISPRIAAALAPEWASFPTLSGQSYYGQPVKKLQRIQNVFNERLKAQGSVATPTVTTPTVAPAPEQAEMRQVAAQSVAQPPKQSPVESTTVPLDMGGGGVTPPPRPPKRNPPSTVQLTPQAPDNLPFLKASNDDNFLSLYSRLTYNIVD